MQLKTEVLEFVDRLEKWKEPLEKSDDPEFWKVAVNLLMQDAEYDIGGYDGGKNIYLEIGACSHWLRPHQTRWKADGGFAWPSGYWGVGYSRTGLPELDWSAFFLWDKESENWVFVPLDAVTNKRRFVLRAALPSRTARHNQAVVHTIWTPGRPQAPLKSRTRIYGFRKIVGSWQLKAWHDEKGKDWR